MAEESFAQAMAIASRHMGPDEVLLLGTLDDNPASLTTEVIINGQGCSTTIPRHAIVASGRKPR